MDEAIEARTNGSEAALDLPRRPADHGQQQRIGSSGRADEGERAEHLRGAGITYRCACGRQSSEGIREMLLSVDQEWRSAGERDAEAVRPRMPCIPHVSRQKQELVELCLLERPRGSPSGHSAAIPDQDDTDFGESKVAAQPVDYRRRCLNQPSVLLSWGFRKGGRNGRGSGREKLNAARVDDLLTHGMDWGIRRP